MPDDRRLTISTSSRITPEEVARRVFGTSRRGFDPNEVRGYLEMVSRELSASLERESELREALADAQERAANPVLDEATITTALGQETARVLKSAHDAANDLMARVEAEAEQVRSSAREEAEHVLARTQKAAAERSTEAAEAAAELHRKAQEEAASKAEAARMEADAMVARARSECRTMVQEAQELRARVLADLTRRRRTLHSQIEQLRAGRERLAEVIGTVRHSVDQITDDLFRAEDEARLAAEAVAHQVEPTPPQEGAAPGAQAGPRGGAPADDVGAELGSEVGTGVPGPRADSAASAAAAARRGSAVPSRGDEVGAPAGVRLKARPPVSHVFYDQEAVDEPLDDPAGLSAPDEASRKQAVEELFARLRASQETVPDTGVSDTGVSDTGVPDTGVPADPAGDTGSSESADPAGPAEARSAAEGGGSSDATLEDPLLVRRDEMLSPVIANLARRLKRALQDDQNDLLDNLRNRSTTSSEMLVPLEEHERRYVDASREQLIEAARCGIEFAGYPPNGSLSEEETAAGAAAELAAAVVLPLRRRLSDDVGLADSDDEAAVADHVGVAFREWKGARIESLAADQVVAAFSQAVLAASPQGAAVRWLVDDDGVACPDCDDNALAGSVVSGEPFPTGHPRPPAHSGCRCLIVPGTA
ncbi:MAG: DivIVA domain-containing protein [Acidimicrobiales bacterium]